MFNTKLREAIAQTFPSRYSRLIWRKLLPDFVDVHLKALTIKWARWQAEPTASEPVMTSVLQTAVVKLARQQKLSYEFLALSHYQHLHQLGALTAECQRLRELHKTALSDMFSRQTPSIIDEPFFTQLLHTVVLQMVGPGHEEEDHQTLLTTFIDEQDKLFDQQLNDYFENLSDQDAGDNPPAPPLELVGPIAVQALFQKQTFEQLAFDVFCLKKIERTNQFQIETLERLTARYKGYYEQLMPLAETLGQQLRDCKEGQHPDSRPN